MTIPPFPSQDLAKLVLGYLAEEQLMTAYDEFLHASPYLDVFRNEYDRIFMTSLKTILADYRAVKIYVETCKPFFLRKKLLPCTHLIDVVKVLASYVDINKLQSQDAPDKMSLPKLNTSAASKHSVCDVCTSLNLATCACRSNQRKMGTSSHDRSSLENCVETTALEDLPGNHTSRKKHARVLEKDSVPEANLNLAEISRQSSITLNTSSNTHSSLPKSNENSSLNIMHSIEKPTGTPECREKIEEFNNILNKVCNTSNADTRIFSISESENVNRLSINTSIQGFASGVSGHENLNKAVPDLSISEKSVVPTFAKDNTSDTSHTLSGISKTVTEHSGMQLSSTYPYPRIKAKPSDPKIKIISDIKVDSPFTAMSNATSTPLMQTIVINGTPAYKQKLPTANNNYTKDEIMAMPTIIVVPTTDPPKKTSQKQTKQAAAPSQKKKKVKTKTVSSTKLLGPLVIDVSSSPAVNNTKEIEVGEPTFKLQNTGTETGLIKTVDVTKNASVPKDNTISDPTHTNTPQVLPPLRKSSSTPRRNSHIRVLDFTTPRRILHDTIHEKVPEDTNAEKSVEIIVSKSPNLIFTETTNCSNNIVDMSSVQVHKIGSCQISTLNENTNVKPVTNKKLNWDADLRALAIASEKRPQVTVKKPRIRTKKKTEQVDEMTDTKKSRGKRKGSPKGKKSKRRKLEEEEELYNAAVKDNETIVAVKPTFNIVAADTLNTQQAAIPVDTQNKSNNEEVIETPEAERISLQNEIGVKLNISDLLETPYKQALYDIQMETPKFLGSVLPDEPISDIKIMNIPTPRFFDTPKPAQATPYSSRATDYSSGGSYYKPDEQDYLNIPDLECTVISSRGEPNKEIRKEKETDNKKSSRPVRKCAKNVSYKSTKGKGTDDKVEVASTCSDSTSINSSFENSKENIKTPKTPKSNKSKLVPKSDIKKKFGSAKNRKTPVKKDKSSVFMKIKPRRPTPTKENKRIRRNTVVLQNNSPKQTKRRVSGKEKSKQITPVLTSAPTKSRRKSSTPRKLHCTKQTNSESSVDSPEIKVTNTKVTITKAQNVANNVTSQDSDTEQLALRWSDDSSQDPKHRVSECEDISKIKEYIESTIHHKTDYSEAKGTLQVDLIKRGFDAETAKIIERDLLDTPTDFQENTQSYVQVTVSEKGELSLESRSKNKTTESESVAIDVPIAKDPEEEEDNLDLSVHECNEESNNYFTCISETKETSQGNPVTLKDAWSMEVCIDDGVPIRLRATTFQPLFANDPEIVEADYSFRETELAVNSIPDMEKLYTPPKDRRSQCFEIFDSTLTSLDTPLKVASPKETILEMTEIEIVVEEERVDSKDNSDMKKRKLSPTNISSQESLNDNNKTKPEAQYLLSSTNIQNIDIESVLKKLHGP